MEFDVSFETKLQFYLLAPGAAKLTGSEGKAQATRHPHLSTCLRAAPRNLQSVTTLETSGRSRGRNLNTWACLTCTLSTSGDTGTW